MVDISFVVPAYNEEKNVRILYKRIAEVMKPLHKEWEINYVDDGSTDRTFQDLQQLKKEFSHVRAIRFTRNFQKAAAMSAGFLHAKGNIIMTLDADLQDDPREIPKFLEKINQGYDLVVGWKVNRKDSFEKRIMSKFFNLLVRRLTHIKLHDSDCNFRAMRKEVAQSFKIYSGLYRYIPSFAHAKGFKIAEVKVRHQKRIYGSSKYGITRLLKGFFDLITVKFLLSYSKRPLHVFGSLGLLTSFLGFIGGVYLLVLRLLYLEPIGSRPLLLLVILLLVLGVQFISIGLIGEIMVSQKADPKDDFVVKELL